ncbi:MAG TPA: hypothetical protein VMC79_15470 [Rectinemataceae bacterium]|nr:hypothetical protein [Rectinemataceae bacterium]
MKKIWFAAALAALGLALAAQPMGSRSRDGWMSRGLFGDSYTWNELSAIRTELGSTALGTVSIDSLAPYWARIQAAAEKDRYVRTAAMMSLHLPGAGQFRSGDPLAGSGFLSLHLALVFGSMVGSYFLLPADLRFDRIDYLNDSLGSIGTAWRSHSVSDYLPALGVAAAGGLLDGAVRVWSARSAAVEARREVASGTAKLEPLMGPGLWGFGLRY